MQRMANVKQSGPWNSLGTHGSLVVMYFQNGETWKFYFLSHIWPWRSTSIAPQNKRDLNQGILYLWSKFGDPSLNGWWVMVRTIQNGVNLDCQVKFDLEGQGRSVHKTTGTLTKVFRIFGPNLVILAWTGPELLRGQASDRQTDTHTHTQTQATTIPEGQNWPRVIKMSVNKMALS